MFHKSIQPRWTECIVAATGPSLTDEAAAACAGHNVIAVSDAYRMLPAAQVLYSCDERWWNSHNGCPDFRGEKWSTHESEHRNNKLRCAERYGLNLVRGRQADGFSFNPTVIHYGLNSGFQAVNLALLFGCKRIVLVGFDMRAVDGKKHFFGDHPRPLSNGIPFKNFILLFEKAAKRLPPDIQILNATPGSALKFFPFIALPEAISVAA
jgi:hypothetical protein